MKLIGAIRNLDLGKSRIATTAHFSNVFSFLSLVSVALFLFLCLLNDHWVAIFVSSRGPVLIVVVK